MPLSQAMYKHNPYYYVSAIRDPAMFFGRASHLRRLYSAITDLQCISIVGPRHIGKSSLLRCMRMPEVQAYFDDYDLHQHILIFMDLGEFLQRTRDDFFDYVTTQLIAQCKDRLILEMPDGSSLDRFSDLLDEIKDADFHPVLLLDAFDTITRNPHFDPDFFTFLRAQANHGKVSYITASIASLDKFCHPDIVGSPFFNIFQLCPLGPLTEDEARELITAPSLAMGLAFSDDEVEWILQMAGRHPFFIQRACYWLFEEKYQHSNSSARVKLKQVKEAIYTELLPHFEHTWHHAIDVETQEHMKDEARRKSVRQRKLPELSESALFRKFVRDTCSLTSVEITIKYLEKVLKNLDDSEFLGESDLSTLNLVYLRMPSGQVTRSVIEKGVVVRKLLQEAFEHLRLEGVQSDTAAEWRSYNILNYCYFKTNTSMSNDQISARLSISSRKFYRDREEAISALLSELHAMELAARDELDA